MKLREGLLPSILTNQEMKKSLVMTKMVSLSLNRRKMSKVMAKKAAENVLAVGMM